MEDLLNIIRREAERIVSAMTSQPRIGLVSSYDPDKHSVKVKFQPEDIESGWIPIQTLGIGNGFGVASAPKLQDQVKVSFQEGNGDTGMVVGRIFSKKDRPPKLEEGETAIRHEKLGSTIKLDKDGKISLAQDNGPAINLDKDGHITLTQASGAVVTVKKDGTIYHKPASGKFVHLGGGEGDGGFQFVQTVGGASTTTKAKV